MSGYACRSVLLLLVWVLVATLTSVARPAGVAAWDAGETDAESEALLVALTNDARAAAGLRSLELDPALASIARWRSKDMAERGYFSHSIPPAGGKVFDELTASGYCYVLAGENIGWLEGPDAGAEERVHRMFLDSDRHRAVITGKAWEAIGIGSFKRADGRHYWTLLFADRCAAEPTPAAETAVAPALLVALVLRIARLSRAPDRVHRAVSRTQLSRSRRVGGC